MSRRGRNEGSIFQRGDGRWVGVVDLGWENGRRKRKAVYAASRREAHDKLQVVTNAIAGGLRPTPERLTTAAYLAEWLEAARPALRPSTFESYSTITSLHLAPTIGRIPLVKLTVSDVERLLRAKTAAGLSPRRVAMVRAVLRRALNRAIKTRMVPLNVAALADGPKQERHKISPLSPDQARAFMTAMAGHRLEGLFVVALTTGLRSGELRALRWQDIDLEARTLSVDAGLARIEGRWQRVPPKSNAGTRTVPLIDRAALALRDHRKRQLVERLAAGSEWIGNPFDLVFVSEVGTPLDGSNITHSYQRELARAGLPRQRLHDARHSCASFWIAAGVPIKQVADMLGHSQISLTLNTYAHVFDYQQAEARDKLGALLGG